MVSFKWTLKTSFTVFKNRNRTGSEAAADIYTVVFILKNIDIHSQFGVRQSLIRQTSDVLIGI